LDLYAAGHLNEKAFLKGHREIQAATGYCSQDSPIAHFGAPSAGGAAFDLKVTFPDRSERIFTNLTPGQKIEVAAISPPLNVEGRKIENRALFYRETIVELTWEPNPMNNDVQKYRIYEEGVLLGEVPATQFSYTIRNLDKNKSYRFAVTAVDSQGLESEPAYASVNPAVREERSSLRVLRTTTKDKL
ncbi:MAG: fibronectin type III domain-containing protein, partial [Acidobacteriota bacterium]